MSSQSVKWWYANQFQWWHLSKHTSSYHDLSRLGFTGTMGAFPLISWFHILAFDLSVIWDLRCTSITFARGRNRLTEHLQIMKIQFQQNQNYRPVCFDLWSFLFPFKSTHNFCGDFPPIWSPFKLPFSISWIYLFWCLWWIVLLRDVKTPFPPPWLADTAPVLLHRPGPSWGNKGKFCMTMQFAQFSTLLGLFHVSYFYAIKIL